MILSAIPAFLICRVLFWATAAKRRGAVVMAAMYLATWAAVAVLTAHGYADGGAVLYSKHAVMALPAMLLVLMADAVMFAVSGAGRAAREA